MSETMSAMEFERPLRSDAAALFLRYPSRLATSNTRLAVLTLTGQSKRPSGRTLAFITKETRVTDTPASLATSLIVIFFFMEAID